VEFATDFRVCGLLTEGTWLKHFGHSNTLYAHAIRAITNYTPISEYYLRFFPRNPSLVHVEIIQSNQEITSCIAVIIIRSIEILKWIH